MVATAFSPASSAGRRSADSKNSHCESANSSSLRMDDVDTGAAFNVCKAWRKSAASDASCACTTLESTLAALKK
ncbi:hypothetical protein D3C72_2252070 [compost metagenome]